jgi:hypothetical protein
VRTAGQRIREALAEMAGVVGTLHLHMETRRSVGRWTMKEWATKLRRAADRLDEGL